MTSFVIPGFKFTKALGGGGQAIVQLWEEIATGHQYAAKIFRDAVPGDQQKIQSEADMLIKLVHPCLVRGFRFILPSKPGEAAIILMEWVQRGSLKQTTLDVTEKNIMIASLCTGVLFLHSHGIIHQDIKPENIMISAEGGAKLSDFGSSRYLQMSLTQTKLALSVFYAAPEALEGADPDFPMDVYSFGLVLFEVLVGKPVFDPSMPIMRLMLAINEGKRPEVPKAILPEVASLIQRCWDGNPANRPTMLEICQTLSGISWRIVPGGDVARIDNFIKFLPLDASEMCAKAEDVSARRDELFQSGPYPPRLKLGAETEFFLGHA
jgi:serine/threonine protein kinase